MNNNSLLLKRCLAFVIDIIFILIFNAALFVLFKHLNTPTYLTVIAYTFVILLYFICFEASPISATPGMIILGIWISYNNNRMHFLKAVVRVITCLITAIPLGFGFWYALLSSSKQTLFDLASGSRVVIATGSKEASLTPVVYLIDAPDKQKYIKIPKGGVNIGRDPNRCRMLFNSSAMGISRLHCNVSYNPQTELFLLEDLCSTYGTYKSNGEQLEPGKIVILEKNDTFYIADPKYTFRVCFK